MRITINIDIDTEEPGDIDRLKRIIDSISDEVKPQYDEKELESAWRTCSWEIISFALAVLDIHDGESDRGVYAYFDSLCNPDNQQICGPLIERSISSRVGRTAVICKKMGDKFRLMTVGTRKSDGLKRVYLSNEAREVLLNLLRTDWRRELENFMADNNLTVPDLDSL